MLADAINTSQFAYSFSGIDGLVAGSTMLFTTLAGAGDFYASVAQIILENEAGIATGGMQYSIGFNGPTYDNIQNGDNLNALTTGQYQLTQFGIGTRVPPSTAVFINIVIPEPTAVTYTVRVYFTGNYIVQ